MKELGEKTFKEERRGGGELPLGEREKRGGRKGEEEGEEKRKRGREGGGRGGGKRGEGLVIWL